MTTPSIITAGLNNINLQLHASSEVSNPYSFNITKDIGFSATCTSENTITITIGHDTRDDATSGISTTHYFYGYNSNTNNETPIFGACSPSTYHGIKISSIYTQITVTQNIQGQSTASIFYMSFAEHVDINNIIINNITYNNISEYHGDDGLLGCVYVFEIDLNASNSNELTDYFINNVGKQITITFE